MLFAVTNLLCIHAKRVTIKHTDMHLLESVRLELTGLNYRQG